VHKAVDLAVAELIAIATPGQGFPFAPHFVYCTGYLCLCSVLDRAPPPPSSLLYVAVTQEQLNRAKESTKSAVLFNLESRVLSPSLSLSL